MTTYKTHFDEEMESYDCLKLYCPSRSTLDAGLGVIFKSDGVYHVVVKGKSIMVDKVSNIPKKKERT